VHNVFKNYLANILFRILSLKFVALRIILQDTITMLYDFQTPGYNLNVELHMVT